MAIRETLASEWTFDKTSAVIEMERLVFSHGTQYYQTTWMGWNFTFFTIVLIASLCSFSFIVQKFFLFHLIDRKTVPGVTTFVLLPRWDNPHFVLLGINYTLKVNLWSIDASYFDESYASPGHNCKISWFLPRGVEGKAKKFFFCSAISGMCHFGPMWELGTSQLVPRYQGLSPARALNSP